MQGDIQNMHQIEDNSVDVVLVTHVLCSVPDVSKGLSEIRRVLKEVGYYQCRPQKASLVYKLSSSNFDLVKLNSDNYFSDSVMPFCFFPDYEYKFLNVNSILT